MKPNPKNRLTSSLSSLFTPLSFAVVAVLSLSAPLARAAVLTWDTAPGTVGTGNGTITGGVGNWDPTTSLGNWTADGGATNVAWANNTTDAAIFQGTGGIVTQAAVIVNSITFSTAGYSVASGTLTLGGTSPKITTTVDAVVSSVLAGTTGLTKDGAGVLSIPTKSTYTGETIVNNGILSLDVAGNATGVIRGTATINTGGTLRMNAGDVIGYNTGANSLTTININGGTLNVNTTTNQTLGGAVINMTGGAITGVANSNLDFFQGPSKLNTLASSVTSTASGTKLSIRQTGGLPITVAKGTTPSGIDFDITSVIGNSGFTDQPLIKAGAGTARLNAANSYTSPTQINAGTLILSPTGTAATSDITVNNTGSLRVSRTGKTLKSLTLVAGSTFAPAALKTGTTTITGALTANGAVTLKPYFLDLPTVADIYTLASAASVAGTPIFTVDTSLFGTSRVAATAALVGNNLQMIITSSGADLIWTNNAATGKWNLNADQNFSNGGSPDVFKTFDSVTFDGTAPGTVTLEGALYPTVVKVTSSSGDYTLTGSGSLAAGTLTKSGSSALTLSSSNNHLATVLNTGTLNIGAATALGTGMLTVNGGTIDNTTGADLTIANPQTWNGSFTFTGTNNLTESGAITLAANSLVTVNANTLLLSGGMTGAFNLSKNGPGLLQLSGAKTHSGSTNVSGPGRMLVTGTLLNTSSMTVGTGSTLELGATNIFVAGHGTALADSRVITVNGGTLLMNANTDFRFGNVTLNDGATWTSNRPLTNYDALLANTDAGAATVTVGGTGPSIMNGSGGIHLQGVQNFAVADTTLSTAADLTVNMILGAQGTIAGAVGGVNKTGPGTMVLNNANLYLGATTVAEGTLVIGAAGSITLSDVTVTGAGLQIDATGKTVKSLAVNAGSTLTLPANKFEVTTVTGALTTTGAITVKPVFTDFPQSGDFYQLLVADTFTDGGTYTVDMTSRGPTRVTGTVASEAGRTLVLTIGTGAADLVWSNGAGNRNWNLNTDLNFKNGAANDVFKTYDSVTFGNTGAGNVNLIGTLYPSSVTVNSTADYTFTGAGTISGGTLTKTGNSTLNLTTPLSPTSVTVSGGTLNLAVAGAVGTGRITIDGGTLNNGTAAPLTLANLQTWQNSAAFTGDAWTVSNLVTLSFPTDVIVGASGLTVSGSINGGSGALVKKGSGALTLNGATASTLSSGLDVQSGSVFLNTGSGAATISVGTGATPASLILDGNQNFNRVADFANILIGAKGTMTINGVNSLPNSTVAANFTVEAGGLLQFVSGGSTAVGATGASHNHAGNITLNGGTIDLPFSGTGTGYNGESVQLDGNVIVGGMTPSTIQFGTGATLAVSGFALSNVPHTFTVADVTNSPAADLIVNAELENSDSNAGSFIKDGPGTMALVNSFAHAYTGLTTVTAGTLIGTGSIAGPLTVGASGTIAPGNPVGAFATRAATIAGTYAYDVNGAVADSLAVTGDLTLTGSTLAVNVLASGATQANYVIATYTGNRVGTFAISPALPAGYSVKYDDAAKQVRLTTAVGSTFSDWIANYPGAAGAPGFGQDADNDGISNGIESVLGTDPSVNTAGLTLVSATANSVTFRHTLTNDLPTDVTYRYQWSADLVEWKASGVANTAGTITTIVATKVVDNTAPVNDIIEVVATRTGTASSKIFVRLVAEK